MLLQSSFGTTRGVTRRLTLLLLWPLALLVAAAFCAAGFWQIARMHQKQAMLDSVATVLATRDARPLSLVADAGRARDYDWAAGSGRFVDAPAVLLDNQSRDDRAGVRVYRLFQSDVSTAMPLLVELGWLPLPGDRTLPKVPRVPGNVTLAGLLSPPPSHGLMAAVAAVQPDGIVLTTGLQAAELPALLRQRTLAPRVLKLDPANPLGYARDLDILPNTLPPERHRGYAVQWFALAVAVLVIALVLTLRGSTASRRRGR